jgi:bacteriocin-type transport-associated protein
MTAVLLKELSNHDINWMLDHGDAVAIAAEAMLTAPGQQGDRFYVLLDGSLAVLSGPPEHSARPVPDFNRLSPGELIGVLPGWEIPIGTPIQALKDSQLLAIPRSAIAQKLQDDPDFAAHLHRAGAVLLAQRLERQPLGVAPARESITVFAGLQDSDLDWLIAVGQVQQLPAQTVLVQPGRPSDALHIVLDGALALSLAAELQVRRNPLLNTFGLPSAASTGTSEWGRLSRGDLVGEMQFVDACPLPIGVTAVRDSQVLSIPGWRLATKLLYDAEFAARFYAVLAQLLAQQQALQPLGSEQLTGPLEDQFLTQVALAEARFDWMLDRIQSQSGQAQFGQAQSMSSGPSQSGKTQSGKRQEIQW